MDSAEAERPFVPGPRSDYVCTRCEERGQCSAEQPWRDLPVKDARCPKCGAKKFMQRIYAANISRDGGHRKMIQANDLVGAAGYDQQRTVKMNAWRNRHAVPWQPMVTSMSRLGKVVQDVTQGAVPGVNIGTPGEARPTNLPVQSSGGGEGVAGALRMPRAVIQQDHENLKA
jgi:DNA-directed RNA polymerase subunit RPC12/RpoP